MTNNLLHVTESHYANSLSANDARQKKTPRGPAHMKDAEDQCGSTARKSQGPIRVPIRLQMITTTNKGGVFVQKEEVERRGPIRKYTHLKGTSEPAIVLLTLPKEGKSDAEPYFFVTRHHGGKIACAHCRQAVLMRAARLEDDETTCDCERTGHSGTFNNNTLGMAVGHAGLSKVFVLQASRDFNAMGNEHRLRLQQLSQGTRVSVTGLGSIRGIHVHNDEGKVLEACTDRKDDSGPRRLIRFKKTT